MDKQFIDVVVGLMREGICRSIAHDMAWGALRLDEHFEAIEHQRRNEAA